MKAYNKKRKPKHMTKVKWVFIEEEGFLLNNGYFCKAQSVSYGCKFKLHGFKTTYKWDWTKEN